MTSRWFGNVVTANNKPHFDSLWSQKLLQKCHDTSISPLWRAVFVIQRIHDTKCTITSRPSWERFIELKTYTLLRQLLVQVVFNSAFPPLNASAIVWPRLASCVFPSPAKLRFCLSPLSDVNYFALTCRDQQSSIEHLREMELPMVKMIIYIFSN